MIYADNAATTKLCIEAFEAMQPYLLQNYGNASQPYFFAKASKKALQNSRETIAECIGAFPNEIYFTSGGTESDNWVIKSSLFMDKKKNKIVTSPIEHHAILNSCKTVQKLKIPVDFLSVDEKGVIIFDSLRQYLSKNTGLVSIMYANNEIGTIEPIPEIARIVHKYGAVFHTDAVQAVGHIPINVHASGIDLLSSSAHKFNGPKGIGFLYIKNGISMPAYIDGGSQELGLRAGTENVAAIVGMAKALKMNINRMDKVRIKLLDIENAFLSALQDLGLEFIRNGAENHLPGNVNVSFCQADGEMLLHRLDLKGICVSTGSACDTVNTQISHVLQAIKVPKKYAEGTIRITFGTDNTVQDAIEIAKSLKEILKQ